ncbi:MAG: N-acetyl-gamma-glutamyl-phosphate reductase [Planctomycetota bacterium]
MRAVVVGCTGYTGRELIKLLVGHPGVEVAGLFASERSAGATIGEIFPELRGVCPLGIHEASVVAIGAIEADVVFLATPHGLSAELAWPLARSGAAVIDLSGGHRLPAGAYPKHYSFEHPYPEALEAAVYGMPELSHDGLDTSPIIAVAGCYVTAASVPLATLDRAGLFDCTIAPAITAISGVSGAGRPPKPHTAFCEVSVQPYGVLSHRHQPEIAMAVGREVGFVPVLGPYDRGIVCTTHAQLANGIGLSDVRKALESAFDQKPLVRVLPDGEWPSVNAVKHTSFLDIAVAVDEPMNRAVVCSSLDNLLKGASGQAVQCMNIRFGLPEALGLIPGFSEGVPA